MWKAIRLLVREGLLDCSQGSRIRLKSGGTDGPPEHSSEALFYAALLKRIGEGTYKAGQPLPKVGYFVLNDHISPNTVAAVCARLGREKLAYKRGKQWIVGSPAWSSAAAPHSRRSPVVLLLFPLSLEWRPFFTMEFVVPFSETFTSEMQHRGITLTLAFLDKGKGQSETDDLPVLSGIGEISAYVKSLGDSFLGTLYFCGMGPYESSAGGINQVLSLGKPVVHFDHRDTLAQWASQFVSRKKTAFFRCHLDEQAAIRLALETLVAYGHTRIGIPWFSSPKADWVPQRIARLQEAAQSISPRPTLVCVEQKEPFWQYLAEFDIRLFRQEIDVAMNSEGAARPRAVSRRAPFSARLFDHTPSLNALLRREKVTALVALNDLMARKLYLWNRYSEIAIPRELSIISFDNHFECRHFPVSTIDFGFSRLGYQAAHILIGDIPVRADRNGNIPGQPMVIDRGSVEPPGDRAALKRD